MVCYQVAVGGGMGMMVTRNCLYCRVLVNRSGVVLLLELADSVQLML